jgi:membrane associated rhomboid family serine protease
VGASLVLWVAWQAGAIGLAQLIVVGPLHGQWWRLLTNLFVYPAGFTAYVYGFTVLVAVFVFGWRVERRHGGVVVLALFFGAGVAGAVATLGVYPHDGVVTGANAAALALLVAWAIPDALAARAGSHYEGDLLAVTALALALLAMPFARPEVSWVAGVVGALLGLLVGFGLARMGTDAV